jgi:hypothetical protein
MKPEKKGSKFVGLGNWKTDIFNPKKNDKPITKVKSKKKKAKKKKNVNPITGF